MASLSGTFTAAQERTTPLLYLRATETVRTTLTVTGSVRVQLCRSLGPNMAVEPIETYTASGTYDWVNTTDVDQHLLLLCVSVAGSTAYTLADVTGDQILQEWRAADGTLVARITDEGFAGGGIVVDVRLFGATGDGVTDDTAAIQAAIDATSGIIAPTILIPPGTYLVSDTIVFDVPNNTTVRWSGAFLSTATGSAVRFGSSSTNIFGLHASGVVVTRGARDTAGSTVGVELQSLVASAIDIRRVLNFRVGVHCVGTAANGGFSYNNIRLGLIHDNRTSVQLSGAGGSGYCNDNAFFGGSFNHSSDYPAVTTTHILVDHFATNELNNNRFYGPSFEDNSALAVAATINGNNNVVFWPRMENPADQAGYTIEFTADSAECQLIGNGFSTASTNITDNGFGSSFETRNGRRYAALTPDDIADAVLFLQSVNTSNARVLSVVDSGGTVRGWIRGDGRVFSNSTGYFQNGIRWTTVNGAHDDRGLFTGVGSPEGAVTALVGSLYTATDGGAGTTLYVKESGTGNTGWVAK